jgi:plastocyanin
VKRLLALLFVVVLTAAVATAVAYAHRSRATATTVAVPGKEFKFILSRKLGRHGSFVFKFKNVGHIAHDFKIAGKKTRLLQPGKSSILRVKISKAGRYRYLCKVPGHAAAGMKGVFVVK